MKQLFLTILFTCGTIAIANQSQAITLQETLYTMIDAKDLAYDLTKLRKNDCDPSGTVCYDRKNQSIIYENFLAMSGTLYFIFKDLLNDKLDHEIKLSDRNYRQLKRQTRNLQDAVNKSLVPAQLIAVKNISRIFKLINQDIYKTEQ